MIGRLYGKRAVVVGNPLDHAYMRDGVGRFKMWDSINVYQAYAKEAQGNQPVIRQSAQDLQMLHSNS